MDNNQSNKPKTATDKDGNMQVRSTGRTPLRTPARTPARIPAKAPAKAPAKTPAVKKPAEAPKDTGREYSFATSALFNNDVKNRKTDATAVSEAKKVTGATPVPSSGTKIIDTPHKRRAARGQGASTTAIPASSVRTEAAISPVRTKSAPVRGSASSPTVRAEGQPRSGVNPAQRAGTPPARPSRGTPNRAGMQGQNPEPTVDLGNKGAAPIRRRMGTPPAPQNDVKTTPTPAVPPRGGSNMATRVGPAIGDDSAARPKRPPRKAGKVRGETATTGIISTFSAMSSVTKSIIYIVCVMVVSIILSAVIITNANDVFAFVKDEKTVSLTIEPGTDLADLAEQLKDEGIIKHENTFKFFIKFRKKDSDSYSPGTYTVSSTMSYDQIISAITPRVEREQIRITIPEGFTVDKIIDLFVEKGLGSREKFVDVINNADFSDYWFVAEMPENPDRYYRLEGYLFPDTYYFYTDMTEDTIIRKFLDNFDSKMTKETRENIAKTKNPLTGKAYTVDEIITLASIIQAEGKERSIMLEVYEDEGEQPYIDFGLISGVFYNRMSLGNPMKLQSDATTAYAVSIDPKVMDKESVNISDYTGNDDSGQPKYDHPYNTYYYKGLTPGAICNPGINAISFSMEPDSCPYYYFLSDDKGMTYFAVTPTEHQENIDKYMKD